MRDPDASFCAALRGHRRLAVCVKGSPDPDALASAFAFKVLAERREVRCRVVATQGIALQQNRLFVKRLALPLEVLKGFGAVAGWADGYVVVDHASAAVDGLSERLPCVAHIDHHEPAREDLPAALRWCRKDVGATSTLLAQLLQAQHERLRLPERLLRRLCTALLFGIQTDTDHYALAGELDTLAVQFLSRFADRDALRRLSAVPLGRTTMHRLKLAERHTTRYKGWLFAGVRYVPAKSRDDIAIIADLLLRREKAPLVVVFALVRDERRGRLTLDASVRSADRRLKLNHLIRRLSSEGGGRRFKGAFQAKLDYFSGCADEDALWALVEQATLEKLRRARDAHYKVKLEGLIESAGEGAAVFVSTLRGEARSAARGLVAACRARFR